jgi:hypothetical protein
MCLSRVSILELEGVRRVHNSNIDEDVLLRASRTIHTDAPSPTYGSLTRPERNGVGRSLAARPLGSWLWWDAALPWRERPGPHDAHPLSVHQGCGLDVDRFGRDERLCPRVGRFLKLGEHGAPSCKPCVLACVCFVLDAVGDWNSDEHGCGRPEGSRDGLEILI